MGRLVANKGNGDCISMAPPMSGATMPLDVVLMPAPPSPSPVPSPFVNTAKLSDATQTIDEVKINGKPAVVRKSEIPRSSGAPNNAIKGIISPPPANNKCNFITSSTTVFAGGYPLVRHRDTTIQNAGNCPGGVKLNEAFSLYNSGIEIDPALTQAQQEAILNNLESLYERPRTRELLDTIRSDHQARTASGQPTNSITVSSNSNVGAPCAPTDASQLPLGPPSNEYNGIGNPSWVQFHPTQSVNIPGYAPAMPPDLALAHELVHALHSARGTTLSGSAIGTMPNGNPAPYAMQNWEQQAMGIGTESNSRLAESRFAEERGMPVRTTHGPPEGNFPFNPSPISVAPVAFSTGAGGEKFVYCNK